MSQQKLRFCLLSFIILLSACQHNIVNPTKQTEENNSVATTNKPLGDQLVHTSTMLVVADIGESVAFYQNKLGFDVREHDAHIALLARDSMLLYLIPESPPTPDKPSVTLGITNTSERTSVNLVFRVKDCRAAYTELSKLGVQFLTPPQQPSWGGWRAFARDPNGYLIEIEEP